MKSPKAKVYRLVLARANGDGIPAVEVEADGSEIVFSCPTEEAADRLAELLNEVDYGIESVWDVR